MSDSSRKTGISETGQPNGHAPSQPPESNVSALWSLYKSLKSLYQTHFPPKLDNFLLKLKRNPEIRFETERGEGEGEKTWLVGFSCKPLKEKDDNVTFGIKMEIAERTSDEFEMTLRLKESRAGKEAIQLKFPHKTFDIATPSDFGDSELDEYDRIPESVELKYTNRKQIKDVLEVWFPPNQERNDTALAYPIELEDAPRNWARFSGDGIVEIPAPNREFHDAGSDKAWNNFWLQVAASAVVYWVVCNFYSKSGSWPSENDETINELPDRNLYQARRPVDLHPNKVIEALKNNGSGERLYFPWHVVESACAALNAGKHVIFTGPPGCGKSKLAKLLAEKATGQLPLLATASPAWTTGDLLGRYVPDREGRGLVFREGFFLRAINGQQRWLIVDEFNRADIDGCFGELFSVLAGDTAELPYAKALEGGGSPKPVRILPPGQQEGSEESYADYQVPKWFRLIGTMNDADRSGLNRLSYALMRRFAFIPVEPPSQKDIRKIIEEAINRTSDDLKLSTNAWYIGKENKADGNQCKLQDCMNEIKQLFACDNQDSRSYRDLIAERAVGVSIIQDVIRFVGEGIRATEKDGDSKPPHIKIGRVKHNSEQVKKEEPKPGDLTRSYLALAVVLLVYPQLEALYQKELDELNAAAKHIFKVFASDSDSSPRMWRITQKASRSFELVTDQTIAEFLYQNLQSSFPGRTDLFKDIEEQWLLN